MYYVTLGNLGYCTPNNSNPSGCTAQTGWGLSNTGYFPNIQTINSGIYWTGTEDPTFPTAAWRFFFDSGLQGINPKDSWRFVWAVHDGKIGTAVIPIPPAIYLFGAGLLGLIGIARRRK